MYIVLKIQSQQHNTHFSALAPAICYDLSIYVSNVFLSVIKHYLVLFEPSWNSIIWMCHLLFNLFLATVMDYQTVLCLLQQQTIPTQLPLCSRENKYLKSVMLSIKGYTFLILKDLTELSPLEAGQAILSSAASSTLFTGTAINEVCCWAS